MDFEDIIVDAINKVGEVVNELSSIVGDLAERVHRLEELTGNPWPGA